jgi:hypothetical protein
MYNAAKHAYMQANPGVLDGLIGRKEGTNNGGRKKAVAEVQQDASVIVIAGQEQQAAAKEVALVLETGWYSKR